MLHKTPDFYAVIREESKYRGQDGGRPFPVSLDHDMSGYLWRGNGDRYRLIDLWLLKPIDDPTVLRAAPILVFDESSGTEEETEIGYQAYLAQAQWFTPLPHQGLEDEYFYITREGKRLTPIEVASIRERKERLHLVKGEQ